MKIRRQDLERYLHISPSYYPCFFSDNQSVAFIAPISGSPQVWKVGFKSGCDEPHWPDQLTFGDDRILNLQTSPVPGDDRFIYGRDFQGDERQQLFLGARRGGSEVSLTAGYETTTHTFGDWSKDGQMIVFSGNRRTPGYFDVYVQPLDGEARLVWQNDAYGFIYHMAFSPDGRKLIFSREMTTFAFDLFETDLETGKTRKITPGSGDVRCEELHYHPDGRSVYLLTDVGSDFLYIGRCDLDSLQFEVVAAYEWDITQFTVADDGQRLAYTVNAGGSDQLWVLDLATGEKLQVPLFSADLGVIGENGSGMLAGHLEFSRDGKYLAFAFSSPTCTANVHVWDAAANRITTLTRSGHGGLPNTSFILPELVHYPTFDGRMIPAWMYYPGRRKFKKLPVVMVVHGGPVGQSRPSFQFFVQMLLHCGYAVMVPNMRGSSGYGKAWCLLDEKEKRLDSFADLATAAEWLKQQPEIDPQKIAIYGVSYGGEAVLYALTYYPHLWAAGVDVVGASNFATFLEKTSEYRRAHREAEYGSLAEYRDFLDKIAPIHRLDKIKAPLMVLHGANDARVPLSETEQLVEAVKGYGIPIRLLVFADEGHGIMKQKNKLVAYPEIIEFLQEYLG